jgi:hypothetical protein
VGMGWEMSRISHILVRERIMYDLCPCRPENGGAECLALGGMCHAEDKSDTHMLSCMELGSSLPHDNLTRSYELICGRDG